MYCKIILHYFLSLVLMHLVSLGSASSIGCMAQPMKEDKDYSHICLNPPETNTMKTSNDSKWNHEESDQKERHIHFGSKSARRYLSSVLHGKMLDASFEDYMNFCPTAKVQYSPGHVDASYFGFDDKLSAELKCLVSAETKGALMCDLKSSTNDFSGSMKVYPHYIDKVSVSTMCFGDGTVGWMVWSTHDYMGIEEEIKVLDYLKSIGFDINEAITYYDDTCPKKCNR